GQTGTIGAPRGLPLARRLRRRAANADLALPAQRMAAAHGDGMADAAERGIAALFAVDDGGGGDRDRGARSALVLRQGFQQGAGERPAMGAIGYHRPDDDAHPESVRRHAARAVTL